MARNEATSRGAAPSSRDSLAGAGWQDRRPGKYVDLIPAGSRGKHFSWLDLRTLWRYRRNELVARYVEDPVDDERRRLVASLRPRVPKDLVVDRSDLDTARFLVVGDPGEGDESQYAVVPPLLEVGKDTQFMVICSDVVYPDGDVNEYPDRFSIPYKDYPGPIYALPGNHDWCDGLNGFMVQFCGAEPSERPLGSNRLLRRLWRRPDKAKPGVLELCRTFRPQPEERLRQPGPYFAIDTGPLRIVCIDTGINGRLDREQGEWLRRVSGDSPKPKVLLTGKPIYVDNEYHEGQIESSPFTVDGIVRADEHNYVAAIGGDIHNYQRYPVKVGDRTIQYVVSGGGGAYMSDTHRIPKVTAGGVDEADFRCYPLRGDSLSVYSRVVDRRFFFGRGLAYIPPGEAAALMGERLGIDPSRLTYQYKKPRRRKRLVAKLPFLRTPRRVRGRVLLEPFFLPLFSEVFDWDEPPFFKSFLRLEATPSKLTITCHGVTGRADQEENPPVEDHVEIPLDARSNGEGNAR